MTFKISYSDEKIIGIIKKGHSKECDKVLKFLYKKHHSKIKGFVLNNKGNQDEADDIFQEAIIIFYQQVENDNFKGKSSIGTYIYGIARNLWYRELKKNKELSFIPVEENQSVEDNTIENLLVSHGNSNLVGKLLDQLKEDCRKILIYFYYEGLSMKNIQEKFSLGSQQSAKTKKQRCLQSLISLLETKKISRDHFI